MSRWLAPPVYIRDAYDAVLRAMDERFVYAGTPESVMQDYLPKPSSKPAYMRGLWGFIREKITKEMYGIFVLPENLGSWTVPYDFQRYSDMDNKIKSILEGANINPGGWFFESGLPLSMVNPSFLEAAYHLLNNYIVYNGKYAYEMYSQYKRTKYRQDNNEIISADTYVNWSYEIASCGEGYQQNISTKMLSRNLRPSYNTGWHIEGEWLIKSHFLLWKSTKGSDFAIVADPGEYIIRMSGDESDNIPTRADGLVDMEYFLHNYKDSPILLEMPSPFSGGFLLKDDTQVFLTKENLPPLNYKYYDS